MWSFFGLLFFGGFLLWKKIDDDATSDALNRGLVKSIDNHKKIVMDDHEEYLLCRDFHDDINIFIEELSKIDEEMVYIFGEEWRDIILSYHEFSISYYDPVGIAYNVYLAYLGYGASISSSAYYPLNGRQYFSQRFKGVKVIERFLQEAHPDLDLELIVFPNTKITRCGKKVKVVYDDDIHHCKVGWKHRIIQKPDKEYARYMKKLSEIDIDEIETDC